MCGRIVELMNGRELELILGSRSVMSWWQGDRRYERVVLHARIDGELYLLVDEMSISAVDMSAVWTQYHTSIIHAESGKSFYAGAYLDLDACIGEMSYV